MSQIPREKSVDSSLALLRDGYNFISKRCQRYDSDIFETRLMLQKAICTVGEEAARMFYYPDRFTRVQAMPVTTLTLLQDKGSVSVLDGDVQRHRKQMFMSLMSPPSIAKLAELVAEQWRADIDQWAAMDRVVLHDAAREVLCRAVCQWAAVPLMESEVKQRTREFGAMVDGSASIGPQNWWAQILRTRTERWVSDIIIKIREQRLDVPEESAAYVVAWHRGLDGELLEPEIGAVELLNLLRPTVAIARFITFAALALYDYPECRLRLQSGDPQYLEWFVHEVRRFYPFVPFFGGRVRQEFEWRDHHFAAGTWVILDLYGTNHDARIWEDPDTFQPERFRHWDGSAYNFIPQGGGDHYTGHRCAGEWITIELLKTVVHLLATAMDYEIPKQDLSVSLSKMLAIPKSRFIIENVRRI